VDTSPHYRDHGGGRSSDAYPRKKKEETDALRILGLAPDDVVNRRLPEAYLYPVFIENMPFRPDADVIRQGFVLFLF